MINISVDLDDVLYPFGRVTYDYLVGIGKFGGSEEELWDQFVNSWTEEQRKYLVSLHFLYDMAPISQENLEYINKLSELGNLYYITARPPNTRLVTERWLRNNNIPQRDNLVMSTNKLDYIKLYDIGFLLDDMPFKIKNVENFCNVYMMSKIWNKNYRDKYQTVNSIKEFYNIIKEK